VQAVFAVPPVQYTMTLSLPQHLGYQAVPVVLDSVVITLHRAWDCALIEELVISGVHETRSARRVTLIQQRAGAGLPRSLPGIPTASPTSSPEWGHARLVGGDGSRWKRWRCFVEVIARQRNGVLAPDRIGGQAHADADRSRTNAFDTGLCILAHRGSIAR